MTLTRSILVFAIAMLGATDVRAQTWDAATDFSSTQNPNGPWSCGWTPTLGGAFSALPSAVTSCPNMDVWYNPGISALSVGKNTSASPISCATWTTPGLTMLQHPGPSDEKSVLRFTAPSSGSFGIAAAFLGVDYAYPTTTDVSVLVNAQSVFSGIVNAYGSGPRFNTTVSLTAGDTVDAVVGFGGNGYFGDATGVTFMITGSSPCLASWANYGAGWSGTLGVPAFTASANPVLGAALTLDIASSTGASTNGILVLGPSAATLQSAYGGALLVNPQLVAAVAIPATGLSLPVVVPNLPVLCGYAAFLQALESDAGASKGVSFTRGITLVLGS